VISSGWQTIPAASWQDITGAGSQDYVAPGDLDWQAVNSWYGLNGTDPGTAAILVYVDDGRGARLLPYTRIINGPTGTANVEFRFVFDTDPNFAQWLDPVVALKSGTWDTNYMANTYLPSLKWRVVVIPP
jgi:hypothetical protein